MFIAHGGWSPCVSFINYRSTKSGFGATKRAAHTPSLSRNWHIHPRRGRGLGVEWAGDPHARPIRVPPLVRGACSAVAAASWDCLSLG
ncbi:hypothetical protein Bpfe_021980 [Biomphalaria pfeifferi]|uniref:Uncharacterized protein n=1 Tax=Biomphalaria pfeifferi TaxID=112525 RepID=A0AAD8B5U0_BIOPF|nr:hypothetical protein Bpfe_021980 [Biomphalaria pfeifferi]